jgi:hypothetical protein
MLSVTAERYRERKIVYNSTTRVVRKDVWWEGRRGRPHPGVEEVTGRESADCHLGLNTLYIISTEESSSDTYQVTALYTPAHHIDLANYIHCTHTSQLIMLSEIWTYRPPNLANYLLYTLHTPAS